MIARKLSALLVGATAAVALQGCPDQPELECTLSRGPFSAKYTLVSSTRISGTGECTTSGGELIGVEQYFPPSGSIQDTSKSTVAIRAYNMGTVATARGVDESNPQTAAGLSAIGPLTSNKPKGQLCTIGAMKPAALELPFVPPDGGTAEDGGGEEAGETPDGGTDASADDGGTDASADDGGSTADDGGAPEAAPPDPGLPAVSMKYEWSNVRFLMKPESPGEAFSADLTITSDGCRAEYKVNAVYYPNGYYVKSCGTQNDAGVDEPNDALCGADPNPAVGLISGSGINPYFKKHVSCDPTILLCAVDTDVEHLRKP